MPGYMGHTGPYDPLNVSTALEPAKCQYCSRTRSTALQHGPWALQHGPWALQHSYRTQ